MKTVHAEKVLISLMYCSIFFLGRCQFGLQLYEVALAYLSDFSLCSHIK